MTNKLIISLIFVLVLLISIVSVEAKVGAKCADKSGCGANEACCNNNQCNVFASSGAAGAGPTANTCMPPATIDCSDAILRRQSDSCESQINVAQGSIAVCIFNAAIERNTCYATSDTKDSRVCNNADKQKTCNPGEGCCLDSNCKLLNDRPYTCASATNFKCSKDSDCQNNILLKNGVKSICKKNICDFSPLQKTTTAKATAPKTTGVKASMNIKCETNEDCNVGMGCGAGVCIGPSNIACATSEQCGSSLNLGFDANTNLFVSAYCSSEDPAYKKCALTYGPSAKSTGWNALINPITDSITNVLNMLKGVDVRVKNLENSQTIKTSQQQATAVPPTGNCFLVGIYQIGIKIGSEECTDQYKNMQKVVLKYFTDTDQNKLDVQTWAGNQMKTYSKPLTAVTYCCIK